MSITGLDSGQLLDNLDQKMAYGYVSDNPLSWVDPFGLSSMYVPVSYYDDVIKVDNVINHYSRNAENDKFLKDEGLYNRVDLTMLEIENSGPYGMKQATVEETVFHRQGEDNEGNLKYTSKVSRVGNVIQKEITNRYGRYEIIVRPNSDGTYSHVNDDINMDLKIKITLKDRVIKTMSINEVIEMNHRHSVSWDLFDKIMSV